MATPIELGKIYETSPELHERDGLSGYSVLLGSEMHDEGTGLLVVRNALDIFNDPATSALGPHAIVKLHASTPDGTPVFVTVDDMSTDKTGLEMVMHSALGWDSLSVISADGIQQVWFGPASSGKQITFGKDTKELSVNRDDTNAAAAHQLLSQLFSSVVSL